MATDIITIPVIPGKTKGKHNIEIMNTKKYDTPRLCLYVKDPG